MTPIQYALAKADEENLDYVLVDHGSSLRIHTTAGKGVGRRGRTDTFIEIHLDLLPTDRAGYLWLLFSGPALSQDGSFLRSSKPRKTTPPTWVLACAIASTNSSFPIWRLPSPRPAT